MLPVIFQTLCFISAISTALLAGIYFIFHNTIMVVLTEHKGTQVMKPINRVIINKTFLLIFLLSPISSLMIIFLGYFNGVIQLQLPLLYGATLAVLSFFITIRFNVPLNERLDKAKDDDLCMWHEYIKSWGTWNSRRYFLSLISCSAIFVNLYL